MPDVPKTAIELIMKKALTANFRAITPGTIVDWCVEAERLFPQLQPDNGFGSVSHELGCRRREMQEAHCLLDCAGVKPCDRNDERLPARIRELLENIEEPTDAR